MRLATVTPQQKKDIRDGKTVTITLKDGNKVVVTPSMVQWAKAQIAAGQPVTILPQIVGTNMMEEVQLS
jgi:hypothetical protein